MADRTNAELYGRLFETLADPVDLEHGDGWQPGADDEVTQLALRLFAMTRGYDFLPYQMGCDDALARLGLASALPSAPSNRRFVDLADAYAYVELPPGWTGEAGADVALFPPTLRPRPHGVPMGHVIELFPVAGSELHGAVEWVEGLGEEPD
jgi:hypothetical protein